MKTRFERWTDRWTKCKLCPLHKGVKKHVLYRGNIPAEILFIGEAPGKVENTLGKPFVGPSGKLLDITIARLAITSFGVANTVCCIPWASDDPSTNEIRVPSDGEVHACAPHITELLRVHRDQPKVIVTLGEVAKALVASSSPQRNIPVAHLRHPAYVLRRGGIDSAEHKKMILALQTICEEFDVDHVQYFTETSYVQNVKTN